MLTKLSTNLKINTYLRQTKINNAFHFPTNLILNDKIKKIN